MSESKTDGTDGQNLIGKKQGDKVKMKIGGLPVEYRVVSVN